MRNAIWAAMTLFLGATVAYADMGFDERYERHYNIFNPVNRYDSGNPVNPVNKCAMSRLYHREVVVLKNIRLSHDAN